MIQQHPSEHGRRAAVLARQTVASAACFYALAVGSCTFAAEGHLSSPRAEEGSLTDTRLTWPSQEQIARVLLLRDYNTRVVAGGTLMLGVAAGMIGVLMLLRRRSLVGDVISHASLPGIAITYLTLEIVAPGSGKSLPALLAGALCSGMLGIACTTAILRYSRIKEDAALAIVLSIFFGFGVAMMTVIQSIPTENAAGLHHFIFGKAASMTAADVSWIAIAALLVAVLFTLFFKEFTLLSFDEAFAAAQGWPTLLLDLALMTLVTVVTVIALQSVGMLLAVAMLVIPAAAARFWTHQLGRMTCLAALLGGAGALLGVMASALFPRLAAGAVIVLAGSALFLVSMLLGTQRGMIVRGVRQRRQRMKVGRDHLLRAFFETIESQHAASLEQIEQAIRATAVPRETLFAERSWKPAEFTAVLRRARRAGLIVPIADGLWQLTERGAREAARVVRNHRLWELYLIEYADIAPSHVDRDADDIEHLLGPEVVADLQELVAEAAETVPPSPH